MDAQEQYVYESKSCWRSFVLGNTDFFWMVIIIIDHWQIACCVSRIEQRDKSLYTSTLMIILVLKLIVFEVWLTHDRHCHILAILPNSISVSGWRMDQQ